MSGASDTNLITRRAAELAQARAGDVRARLAGQLGGLFPGVDIRVEGEQIIVSGRRLARRWARLGPDLLGWRDGL